MKGVKRYYDNTAVYIQCINKQLDNWTKQKIKILTIAKR